MGFFDTLGKIVGGKPLGPEKPTDPARPLPPAQPQGDGIRDARGLKIIPDIDVKNVKSLRRGDKLIVKAWIFNRSADQVIRVDTTNVLDQKRTQNQEINPGGSRELTLYDGYTPDNDDKDSAQIAFRLKQNGDVFMENYRLDYHREDDGKYIVGEFSDDGPTRDI